MPILVAPFVGSVKPRHSSGTIRFADLRSQVVSRMAAATIRHQQPAVWSKCSSKLTFCPQLHVILELLAATCFNLANNRSVAVARLCSWLNERVCHTGISY